MRYGNPSKKTKTIASTRGHAIEFPGKDAVKDPAFKVPPSAEVKDGICFVRVPDIMQAEVASQGMLPEEEVEEKEEAKGAVKPEAADALQAAAFGAFDKLVAANDRESFAGNGHPKAPAIEKVLGYPLTNNEIKELWNKYQVDKAAK